MEVTSETPLPALRDELQFIEGAPDGDGHSGFLIFDPVAHKYFRIGLDAAQAFGAWSAGSVGDLIERLKGQGIVFDLDEVSTLIGFVSNNSLIVGGKGGSAALIDRQEKSRQSLFMRGLHGYLFFKIPLVRPQSFLDATFPYVRWLGSSFALKILLALTLAGLYLTSQQLDVFFSTFADFANLQGVILLGVTLAFLKTAHEFGHAYAATKYKCQVPVMGIAFMLMFPMLYSDTSDAWRLKMRRQRLMIDGAGMMTEMGLAGVCLLLWALLPDGPIRTICFFIATTGWITSLAVNLSPFMRFDGYHILADSLGIHNLQPRGFAIGKWQMRKILFGLEDEVPESFSPRLHKILVAYAWGTWVFRFFLFLGIALLVYFFFFKVLGIFLFVVEIVWFLGLPIYKELEVWWQRRGDIKKQRRALVTFSIFFVFLGMLFLPLERSVNIPAVLLAANETQYYAPVVAKVEDVLVKPGEKVQAGEALMRLSSPVYREAIVVARLNLALVDKRLARGAVDRDDRSSRAVLLREQSALISELAGLAQKQKGLVIRASMEGVVTELAQGLAPGLWVNQDLRLAHIVRKNQKFIARGLVSEIHVDRLQPGNKGVFVSENAGPLKLAVTIEQIGLGNGAGREMIFLSSKNQGPVVMDQSTDGQARTAGAIYPVLFSAEKADYSGWVHEQRGTIVVQAQAQSMMGRFFRHSVSVLLREVGF